MSATRTAPPAPRILVVEDDPKTRDTLVLYLEHAGFLVCAVGDGAAALAEAERCPPDLVVLDRMLPGLDGMELCRRLREDRPHPVIFLTARATEEDRLAGLELGADDYVVKPFSPRELVARVRAVLRRAPGADLPQPLTVGDLTLDPGRRCAEVAGRVVPLTAREFRLMATFARAPGRTFSREELVERAFGDDFDGFDRTVDAHVVNLRRKLEADPSRPTRLVTVFGAGYRLDVRPR
ncbi:MAG: response regulator transcription factor [Candidatus Eisenbacteria bacterium]